jgi:hypothetical protein
VHGCHGEWTAWRARAIVVVLVVIVAYPLFRVHAEMAIMAGASAYVEDGSDR